MSTDAKILEFPKKKQVETTQKTDSMASIVDLGPRRQEIIDEERRSVKRTILTEFIGAHVIVPGAGLQKCALHDISVKGISFDLLKKQGQFKGNEEVAVRIYLNYKTYFSFIVNVRSSRWIKDEAVYRHGASFVEGTVNKEAIEHFIRFVETISASLKTDQGDVIVSNLDQSY